MMKWLLKRTTWMAMVLFVAFFLCILALVGQFYSVKGPKTYSAMRNVNYALRNFHPSHLVPSELPQAEPASFMSAPSVKTEHETPSSSAERARAPKPNPAALGAVHGSPSTSPTPASSGSSSELVAATPPAQPPAPVQTVAPPPPVVPPALPQDERAKEQGKWAWSAKAECAGAGGVSVAAEINCLTRATVEREVGAGQGKIAFLKTHKTGSTTFAAILHRYASRHCLRVYDAPWRGQHYYTGASHGTEVDVFNRHVSTSFFQLYPALRRMLRAEGNKPFFFVTVIREPVEQWVSAFNYYTWPNKHSHIDQYVASPGATQNPLSTWDLKVKSEADVRRFVSEGLPLFDCIVLTHRWAEGLTILGERLGWHAIDTTHIEMLKNKEGARNYANAPTGQFKASNLTAATRGRIEELVRLDRAIYQAVLEYYEKQLAEAKARIGEGEFASRVAETERVQRLVGRQCAEHAGSEACVWHRQSDINLEHDAFQGYPMSHRRAAQYHLGGKDEPAQAGGEAEYPTGCEAKAKRDKAKRAGPAEAGERGAGATGGEKKGGVRSVAGGCNASGFFAGVDIRGGEVEKGERAVRASTAEECCAACAANPECRYFTMHAGQCWIKARMPVVTLGAQEMVSGAVAAAGGDAGELAAQVARLKGRAGEGGGGGGGGGAGGKHALSAVLLTRVAFAEDRMRQEFRELREWLEFALYAGFDHIYVYDNWRRPNETLVPCLQSYIARGLVTYHDWNQGGTVYDRVQKEAYQHFIRTHKSETALAMTLDMDEYPMVWADHQPGFLLRFLQRRIASHCHIYFQCQFWVGPDPVTKQPGELLMERYPHKVRAVVPYPGRTKTAYRTDVTAAVAVHSVTLGPRAAQLGCGDKYVVGPEEGTLVHFWGHRHWDAQEPNSEPDSRMRAFAALFRRQANLSSPPDEFKGVCATVI